MGAGLRIAAGGAENDECGANDRGAGVGAIGGGVYPRAAAAGTAAGAGREIGIPVTEARGWLGMAGAAVGAGAPAVGFAGIFAPQPRQNL